MAATVSSVRVLCCPQGIEAVRPEANESFCYSVSTVGRKQILKKVNGGHA